ncbi:MAG: glycosyltransferase [Candidatus Viridilinea halotolerans]|uniref:Glycosyltransferase n=1 Tax=Candidatus Viridilinea halotolerans TaxID=2491704 RepID=A0A426UBL8_9CHLR|nr:MAG: glycosyltransferase [Candidatus Viridilinea halotolerans]
MYNIAFILEQALGHATHAANLQQLVPLDREVQAHWALVPFAVHGLAARLPGYGNWTVRAGWRAQRLLRQLRRRQQLDLLFFHTQVPATLNLAWLRRTPSVISLDATPLQYDELGPYYAHQAGPLWAELLKWRLSRACFAAARHLVAWSEWTRQGLIRGYGVPSAKVSVIPPGVVSHDWQCPQPRTDHAGPLKILFVGGNLERKGGLLLLEAWRQLNRNRVELHLVTRDHVAPAPGLFVYNQMQPNSATLRQIYHTCDIFALPTYGDCLPMVLSEAGAAGLPLVATQVAAIPEVVHDGVTGLLIPAGDSAALTVALQRLLDQPLLRLKLGEQAQQHVAKHYDAHTNTQRLLDLLKHVVHEKPHPVDHR